MLSTGAGFAPQTDPPQESHSMGNAPDALPARARHRSPRWLLTLVALLVLLALAPAASADGPPPIHVATDLSALPVDGGEGWEKIGDGPVIHVDGWLVCNDNDATEYVAFQGLLGDVQAEHDVIVRTSMDVLANFGGQGAMIELSRPGLELIVQLYPDRVEVLERQGRDLRWLGGAPADLSVESVVELHKASSLGDPRETLTLRVDDVALVRVAGQGEGSLGVGRVVFGSMGYPDTGITRWHWIEVVAEAPTTDTTVPTDARSFGSLKAAFDR